MKVIQEFIYHEKRAKQEGQPGHHYILDYERTDYYCPSCGKQEVWVEQSGGDYYAGADYVCVACSSLHHLDSSCSNVDDGIVEQLKSGVTKKPITPKGR